VVSSDIFEQTSYIYIFNFPKVRGTNTKGILSLKKQHNIIFAQYYLMKQYNLKACSSKSSQCVTWVKIQTDQVFNKYFITAQIIVYRVLAYFFFRNNTI